MNTSDHSSGIESLMKERMALVGELSRANAELMRALQLVSGLDILQMRDSRPSENARSRSEADNRVVVVRRVIDGLESDLMEIDKRMENAMNQESLQ